MDAEWARLHRPVLSQKDTGHVLYTKYSWYEPGGKVVLCHNRTCNGEIKGRADGRKVKLRCNSCGSTCVAEKVTTDQTTVLGRKALVKTRFPQEQYLVEWKTNKS
jgi:hypothetical protein